MILAPDLETRLTQGMTFAQLLERSRHASLLRAFLEAAPPEPLPEEVAWVLALVEDWCPDCHQAAPVLAKAAGERARFFFRDENPDLREAYKLGEKRIVPTLVFLDRELKELARWHGPPEEARGLFPRPACGRRTGEPGGEKGPPRRLPPGLPPDGQGHPGGVGPPPQEGFRATRVRMV
jgi:thiol-disulfide isomerase/thioredoxin